MEFFYTIAGRKLLEGDIPRLIKGMDELTAAMNKNNELREKELALREKEIELEKMKTQDSN